MSKRLPNKQNLNHVYNFYSNCVGGPFGPQKMGPLTLMCLFSRSSATNLQKALELAAENFQTWSLMLNVTISK